MLTVFRATLFSLAFTTTSILHNVYAATIDAKSVSFTDVSSAVAAAKDGDTVTVPAGVATWTAPLTITNNITLQGAGAASTTIIDEIERLPRRQSPGLPSSDRQFFGTPKGIGRRPIPGKRPNIGQVPGSNRQPALIFISLERDLPFRLTGFTFRGGANSTGTYNGEIHIAGKSHSFRIDHCTFDGLHSLNVSINGFLWGVIDHCQFNLAKVQPMQIYHASWNGGDHGNGSWADDPFWGSEKFVFIEDNVFDNPKGFRRSIDGYEGARFVVRYNQFHNSGLTGHGTEGQGRGARAIEEYNNIYRNDQPVAAPQIRSGSFITHDNKWTNFTKGHVLEVYRQFQNSPHWGWSDGQNPYDDNAPKPVTGYWERGTHTGVDGASMLVDSTKNWTTNQWHQPGATYILRNKTREAQASGGADKGQSFVISNTANTANYSILSGRAGPLTFNKGDIYEIWRINHSLDQPGLGKGNLLKGLPGLPAKWPNQVTEPCYSWNNTQNGTAVNLSSTQPSIREGRDFFNETPRPGYRPYIYPHPLVSAAAHPGPAPH